MLSVIFFRLFCSSYQHLLSSGQRVLRKERYLLEARFALLLLLSVLLPVFVVSRMIGQLLIPEYDGFICDGIEEIPVVGYNYDRLALRLVVQV